MNNNLKTAVLENLAIVKQFLVLRKKDILGFREIFTNDFEWYVQRPIG